MQFFVKDRDNSGAFGVWQDWTDAPHNIGGMEMKHLKDLMESADYQSGYAAQHLVVEGQGEQYSRIAVFAGADYVFCYDYMCQPFTLDLKEYEGDFAAYWVDPVSGGKSYFKKVKGGERLRVTPMKRREGHSDWVLALYRE